MKSKGNILIPVIKTAKLIKKEQIDIVHTHTVRSNMIGRLAALLTGRRCVTHLHSPILRDFADYRRGRFNEAIDILTRPFASRYIAVSNSLRQEMIRKRMPGNKIVTVHNGLHIESLNLSASDNRNGNIREEYGIQEKAFLLAMVALLRPRKGVEIIIRAMKSILKIFPNTYLLIVGNDDISEDPDYGKKLKTLARDLGIATNVIFTGFRDDVPSILNQCDLMVLPSLFGEGLPMVILEAMALGIPVVASNIEGIPELIEDGVNGFLFNAGDAEELSYKIIGALKDPVSLQNIVKAARQKVLNGMDGYEQARRVEKVYREVLAC